MKYPYMDKIPKMVFFFFSSSLKRFTYPLSKMTVVFILYFIFLFISFGLLLLYLFQDKILYVTNPFNTRYVFDKPERFRLYKWEDVFIDTIDGEKIHAWLIKTAIRSESAPTMLYFHGNAGSMFLIFFY